MCKLLGIGANRNHLRAVKLVLVTGTYSVYCNSRDRYREAAAFLSSLRNKIYCLIGVLYKRHSLFAKLQLARHTLSSFHV
jgi:hypothetical protein